jgi:hypothetical protein
MTPGYGKPRSHLPWLPYESEDRVIINAHNFTPPVSYGFGDELLILRGPTGLVDQSASGLSASYNGGMGVVADTSNNGVSAFLFDGTNDAITIASASALAVSPVLTLAMWLRISAWPTTGNFAGIAGMWNPPGNQRGYAIYLSDFSGSVIWQVSKNGTVNAGQFSVATQTGYAGSTWYLVIAEIDSGPANLIRSGTTQAHSNADATTIHPSTTFFGIGCQSNAGTPYRFFNGRMDDVRVFNRLLTSTEKSDWLAAGRGYDAP